MKWKLQYLLSWMDSKHQKKMSRFSPGGSSEQLKRISDKSLKKRKVLNVPVGVWSKLWWSCVDKQPRDCSQLPQQTITSAFKALLHMFRVKEKHFCKFQGVNTSPLSSPLKILKVLLWELVRNVSGYFPNGYGGGTGTNLGPLSNEDHSLMPFSCWFHIWQSSGQLEDQTEGMLQWKLPSWFFLC